MQKEQQQRNEQIQQLQQAANNQVCFIHNLIALLTYLQYILKYVIIACC
jgi:hypothetical protein